MKTKLKKKKHKNGPNGREELRTGEPNKKPRVSQQKRNRQKDWKGKKEQKVRDERMKKKNKLLSNNNGKEKMGLRTRQREQLTAMTGARGFEQGSLGRRGKLGGGGGGVYWIHTAHKR